MPLGTTPYAYSSIRPSDSASIPSSVPDDADLVIIGNPDEPDQRPAPGARARRDWPAPDGCCASTRRSWTPYPARSESMINRPLDRCARASLTDQDLGAGGAARGLRGRRHRDHRRPAPAAAAVVGVDPGPRRHHGLPRRRRVATSRRTPPRRSSEHRDVLVRGLADRGLTVVADPAAPFVLVDASGWVEDRARRLAATGAARAGLRRPPRRDLPRTGAGLDPHRRTRSRDQPRAAQGADGDPRARQDDRGAWTSPVGGCWSAAVIPPRCR